METKSAKCSICREYFKEPKILPCGHLLCRNCLVSWLNKSSSKLCPLCRYGITDCKSNEAESCEKMADSFPTDLSMVAVVESTKLLSMASVCCACENVAAESMCLTCAAMMCETCVKVHNKLPASQAHKVEKMSNLTPENLPDIRQATCVSHPGEPSKLFCPTHNAPICHLCAASKHRTCAEVMDLNEALAQSKESLSEIHRMLKKKEEAFTLNTKRLEELLGEAEKNRKVKIESIDRVCDILHQYVEKHRQHLMYMADGSSVNLKDARDALDKKRAMVTRHILLLERALKTSPCTSTLGMTTLLKTRTEGLDLDPILPGCDLAASIGTSILNVDPLKRIKEEIDKLEFTKFNWRFHGHCGRNIKLTDNQQTAESIDYNDGMAMSSEPMEINVLYEVRVDSIDTDCSVSSITTGVVLADPATLELPPLVNRLKSAIGISSDNVCVDTILTNSACGSGLKNISKGSRVGVLVDSSKNLHLYLDGKDQGIAACGLKEPYYAMFNPCLYISKVRVDSIDTDCSISSITTGVVLADPATLKLPPLVNRLNSAIGISSENVCVDTKLMNSACGSGLKNISKGSRVGVLVDPSKNLHLYLDGKDQGIAVCGLKEPYYAMFNPCLYISKVTTLPVTIVT